MENQLKAHFRRIWKGGGRRKTHQKTNSSSRHKDKGQGLGPELQRLIFSRLSQFFKTFKSRRDKNPTIHGYINGFSTICR